MGNHIMRLQKKVIILCSN